MDIIAELRAALPPIFLGSKIDKLTGGLFNWGTIQNRRSRGEYENEDEIFFRVGMRRDPFLASVAGTLSPARRLPVLPPRRKQSQGPTESAQTDTDAALGKAELAAERRPGAVVPPPRGRRRDREDEARSSVDRARPATVAARTGPVVGGRDPPSAATTLPRRRRRSRADELERAVSSG